MCLLFAALGYYPWLTYLTGVQAQAEWHAGAGIDAASALLDYVYFGVPLLLVLGLLPVAAGRGRRMASPGWMIAAGIALLGALGEGLGKIGATRYVMGNVLLLAPLLAMALTRLQLTRRQVAMIPIANALFVGLVTFL